MKKKIQIEIVLCILFILLFTTNAFGLDEVIFNNNCQNVILTVTETKRVDIEKLKFIPCRQIDFETYDCDCPEIKFSYIPGLNETPDFQFKTVIDYLQDNQVKSVGFLISIVNETLIVEPERNLVWKPKIETEDIIQPIKEENKNKFNFIWKKEYNYLLLVIIIILLFFVLRKNGKKSDDFNKDIKKNILQSVSKTSKNVENKKEMYIPVGAKPINKKIYLRKNGFKLEKEYEVIWERVK